MRLDQILSRYGYCSRGESRGWFKAGRVKVDGVVAREPETKASPFSVTVDDQNIEAPEGLLVLLNKPAGVVCSHDPNEGPRVYDLLPPRWLDRNPPIASIGRLDKDTTGVLLFTDQGTLIHAWTSPRHKVAKVYEVETFEPLLNGLAEIFAAGTLMLDGDNQPCAPAKLEVTGERTARLEIIEGKYHQVKRMFAAYGCSVVKLHRCLFGKYDVQGMAPGEWKILPLPSNSVNRL